MPDANADGAANAVSNTVAHSVSYTFAISNADGATDAITDTVSDSDGNHRDGDAGCDADSDGPTDTNTDGAANADTDGRADSNSNKRADSDTNTESNADSVANAVAEPDSESEPDGRRINADAIADCAANRVTHTRADVGHFRPDGNAAGSFAAAGNGWFAGRQHDDAVAAGAYRPCVDGSWQRLLPRGR